MRYAEKLYNAMVRRGLTQHRLATEANVSNSEISRILNGKSSPSLEYAARICRVLGISLDDLADDAREVISKDRAGASASLEREIQERAEELGWQRTRRLLETTLDLGYETAIRRLLGLTPPIIEVETTSVQPSRSAGA